MVAAELNIGCGLGLGWRAETAAVCAARSELVCFEVIAESLRPNAPIPDALEALIGAGRPVIPHGVGLGLGSGERPSRARITRLVDAARRLRAPIVSEHLAWVRAGGVETEHLLPVPRTRRALELVASHIHAVQDALPCPLVIENIAALFAWPDDAIAEADFLAELVARTGVGLLIDVANLHANLVNGFGGAGGRDLRPLDPDSLVALACRWIRRLPPESITYLHLAGGRECGGFRHDTHADPVAATTLAMTQAILGIIGPRPVVLERDDHFGTRASFEAELDALVAALPVGMGTPAPPRGANAVRALSSTEDAELTVRQAGILAAALQNAPTPPGFDGASLSRVGTKLQAKMAWVAERRAAKGAPTLGDRVAGWTRRLWSRQA